MFEINKIYNLDVFEYLDMVPENSIDLVVTDPPYNMKKVKWDTFKSHKDYLDFTFAWIDKTLDKLKKNRQYLYF